jgi:hypothetical protein
MTKGKLNPYGKKKNIISTHNFTVEGFPDDIYEGILKFLKDSKIDPKVTETSYLAKCKTKGFNELEFSVKLLPINNLFVIVEIQKIRGNTIKFHEVFRSLKENFATDHQKDMKTVDLEEIEKKEKERLEEYKRKEEEKNKKSEEVESVEKKDEEVPDVEFTNVEDDKTEKKE